MLVTPLVEKIEELRGTIRFERDTVGAHELRTRVVLIDPVLRMVGWPPEDPRAVVVEYATGTGRADYALLGESARPVALLEAKVLGSRLEEHTRQIVTYATETGIGSAGITDGDRWMLYDVFRPAPMEDKRVMDVRLTRDEPLAAALDLLAGLTRPALSPPQTEVGRGQGPGQAKDYGRTAPGGEWTTAAALEEPQAIKVGAELRFPDGKTWEVRTWQHAVGRVAEWLVTTGRLPEERLPLRVGDIVRGVHWEPVHSDGARFNRLHEFSAPSGRQVYVHTHGARKTSVSYIRSMLDSCGIPERDVSVRILSGSASD